MDDQYGNQYHTDTRKGSYLIKHVHKYLGYSYVWTVYSTSVPKWTFWLFYAQKIPC